MREHTSSNFFGFILGMISLAIVKITYPHTVSLHRTVKRMIANPKDAQNFGPEQFALAVLKHKKEVFEKLAEM